jgi:hypothetical protein
MARKYQAGQLLLDGQSPQEVAKSMGISLASIRQYLCTLVGEGWLLASDIAFSISIAERADIENAIKSRGLDNLSFSDPNSIQEVEACLKKRTPRLPRDLIILYVKVRDPRPDLYALLCELEVRLHAFVRRSLHEKHAAHWWRQGIPLDIRQACQIRKEADTNPLDDPFQYTNFIDLKNILSKNWGTFQSRLPKSMQDKKNTLENLQRLNELRNRVMHPVKLVAEYECDFHFTRKVVEVVREIP